MILKLIKHELKATLPNLTSVFIALFGLAIVGPILLNFNAEWLSVIVMLAAVAALIAVSVVTFLVIINLFNKRTFGPQGYLNITLPVSTTQLLLSKILSAVIISMLTGLMTFLAVIAFAFSASWILFGGLEPLSYAMSLFSEVGLFSKVVALIFPFSIVGFAEMMYSLSLLLFVITFVHTSYVRKNKMVVAVISYLGIMLLISVFITNILGAEFVTMTSNFDSINFIPGNDSAMMATIIDSIRFQIDWLVLGMTGAFYLVMAGIFFTLSQYFMDHKLEIE